MVACGPDPARVVAEHLRLMRMAGRAQTTIDGRRCALARMSSALPGGLLAATEAELLDWRAGLAVGDGTVRAYVGHARQFYAWACRQGYVTTDPAAALPAPRKAWRLPRPISTADLMLALSSAPPRIRLWLVLAAWCGLRAKEIALLRRENILLTLPQPVLLVASDATKGIHERAVPLNTFVVAEVGRAGLPLHGWCFTRRDGRPGPNRPARVSGLAADYLRSIGVAATLHMLRHWFGTRTYQARKDLRAVQELMGHKTIEATQGYADWDRSTAADIVEALPVPPQLRVIDDAG